MNSGIRIASMAAASALLLSFSPVSAGAAGGAAACAPRSEVRGQVSDLVAGLRDDVKSAQGRSALAHALVEALHTFRGDDADTAEERRVLGQEVSALAAEMREENGKVEAKALVAWLKAIHEQRERGAFTAEERAELRAALDALRNAVVAKADKGAERQDVAAAVRAILAELAC